MMKNVYHYDGVTKTSILSSVVKLTATQGVYPDFGGLSVDLTYPVLDASGNEVTLAKGDLIWACTEWSTNQWFTHGLGVINDIRRSGDLIVVKAESIMEPLMRMRYTIDNGLSGFLTARLWDVITKHNPPHGIAVGPLNLIYRKETGSSTWNLDTTMGKVVHNLEVDVRAYFQYLIEQPVNLWLEKPTGTIFPVYDYNDNVGMPSFKVGYTGYGNHRAADKVLSYDAGVLSKIEWQDPTDSVLNDVTITVRGGGTEQYTDPASITAYGKRQTTLSRGIFTEDAIGGYDATRSIKSIVKSMAVPHKRCRLTCEIDALLNNWQTVGGMYRVVDELTGQDEYMALRSFTYRYPEEIAECEFDNAPLDMSKYGLRMENRVTSLEASLPSQSLDTTSSPRFTAINIGTDCQISRSGTDLLYTPDSLQLAGGVYAGSNITALGTINVGGRVGQEMAIVNITRGANNFGWNYRLAFNPYVGDGALSDSKPSWFVQAGYSSHELNVKHWNGSVESTVMQFLVDKTINIVNGLTCGPISSNSTIASTRLHLSDTSYQIKCDSVVWFTNMAQNAYQGIRIRELVIQGSVTAIDANNDHTARYMNLTGADYQLRCDNRIRVRNIANTVYQDIDMKRLYISGTLCIDETRGIACGVITANRAHFTDTTGQLRCDSDITLCTLNGASWKAIKTNGYFIESNQVIDAARDTNFNSVAINGTTVIGQTLHISGASLAVSGRVSGATVRVGATIGDPEFSKVGANDIGVGALNGFTQGGLRWLGEGRRIYAKDYPFQATASANYRNTHDAEKTYTWLTGYQKQKTITLVNGLGEGSYRVYFEIASIGAAGGVYGRVYKNGVAIGTQRVKTGTTYVGYTEDFGGPLEPGTTIELWCYQNGGDGNGGKCRNFRIGYDLGLPTTMPATNS